MKYFIVILLFFSCCTTKPKIIKETIIVTDTIPQIVTVRDTIYIQKDNEALKSLIKRKNDTILIERYKIERIKYYTALAQRNSSQLKFLIGWINRAVKD